jgi:hypothetical protein
MFQVERDAMSWAACLFGGCELGDARRTRRLVKTVGLLATQVGASPLRASGGDGAASEGAYRLIRNEAVEASAIAAGGFEATVRAARECGTLLAVEDTTVLSYEHEAAEALGDLGGPASSEKRGYHVHSVLLLEAETGRTLGLVEQRLWCREGRGSRHQRRERPYEEKESSKWGRASASMRERLVEVMPRVVSVCDREADVYEYLSEKRDEDERFVVRASWDRRVEDPEALHLFEQLATSPVVGSHRVRVGQRGGWQGRKAREVELELRSSAVTLRAPTRVRSLGELRLNAVLAREVGSKPGQAAVSWLLLTSEPVDDEASARRVLSYYALRWRVEEFHKAWKSGTQVEARRMQSAGNLARIATMLAFVAVRVLQLREVLEAPSDAPARPCTEVLDEDEWRVLWLTAEDKRVPKKPPSLRWAYERVAKLGGFIDTKRTGRAGWETLWAGWFRLQERVCGYRLALGLATDAEM